MFIQIQEVLTPLQILNNLKYSPILKTSIQSCYNSYEKYIFPTFIVGQIGKKTFSSYPNLYYVTQNGRAGNLNNYRVPLMNLQIDSPCELPSCQRGEGGGGGYYSYKIAQKRQNVPYISKIKSLFRKELY